MDARPARTNTGGTRPFIPVSTQRTFKKKRPGGQLEAGAMEARRSNAWLWPMLAILPVVALVVLLVAASASSGSAYYGMMGVGWGWGVAMMLIPLGVLVLLLLVIVGAASPRQVPMGYAPPAPPPVPSASALEILDARYARGEISRDEYLRIRSDLTGAHGRQA